MPGLNENGTTRMSLKTNFEKCTNTYTHKQKRLIIENRDNVQNVDDTLQSNAPVFPSRGGRQTPVHRFRFLSGRPYAQCSNPRPGVQESIYLDAKERARERKNMRERGRERKNESSGLYKL